MSDDPSSVLDAIDASIQRSITPPVTYRARRVTRRIIVHDSHTDPALPSTVDYLRVRGRVLGLMEVGYHYVIEQDGRVVCTRPHPAVGSHCLGFNHDSIGVCLAGGHHGTDDFTQDQLMALRQLIGFLRHVYKGLPVVAHSELPSPRGHGRRCPALDIESIRKEIMDTPEAYATQVPKELTGQQDLIIRYLRAGRTLTTMHAINSLGVHSLSSRIAELRALGHEIVSEPATDFDGRRYFKYKLPADGVEAAD